MRLWRSRYTQTALVLTLLLFSALSAAAQAPNVRPRVTQAVDEQNLVTLRGSTHSLARTEYDRGAAPDDQPLERMLLVLQRGAEQEAALRKLLDEQQIKSAPNYHQWLTPQQFGQQFGPADADIQAVTDWLTSQGFQVDHAAAGRTVIEFSGTAGLVRQALHTEIHKFIVNGGQHWANVSDPQIPAALAPVVAGVASLNNFPRKPLSHRLGTFARSKATGEVRPLFTFPANGGGNYAAVGPTDFATIYNVSPLYQAGIDGTGQTIAIVAQTNINPQDVADFRNMFGLPANAPQIILNGPDPGVVASDEGEADVDVEWAGAVAKNATIKLVVSESTGSTAGIDLSALYIVDNNLAPVLSESYGACEAGLGSGGNAFYSALWEQAAAQGITVVTASGDSGSAGCDNPATENAAQFGLAADGTASTPFNVAVGGTDFDDFNNLSQYWNSTNTSPTQSSAKSYIPESTWNDSCANTGQVSNCASIAADGTDLVAAGGGPSAVYTKPSWQVGTGVPADTVRDIPDVSLFSGDGFNASFYVICQMDANTGTGSSTSSCDLNAPYQNFQGGGGTSISAQAFAGIMALVNQKTGQRQGNANYVLYKLAAQSGASCNSSSLPANSSGCVFYDVTTGNISVACVGGTPNCSNTTIGGFGIMVSSSGSSTPAWPTSTGYDLATGLGTVNAANLVNKWNSVTFTPTTTTLSLSTTPATNPITLTHGQSVNVTIHVTSASGTPTGDVSLIGGPNNSALGIDAYTLSSGNVSSSTVFLPGGNGGTYNVTAHYAGDGTFAASDSNSVSVTVNKESSRTFVGLWTFDLNGNLLNNDATAATYGSPYILRVDVTNNSSQQCFSASTGSIVYPCPTGSVSLTDNGQPLDLGTYSLNSQGHLEDQPIQFPVGSHSVVANYAGDNSYNTSLSATDAITITQAAALTSVTANPATAAPGANVTLTAVVNTVSNGVAPTGTVQFLNGGIPINGTVTYTPANYSPSTGAFASLQATVTTTFPVTATVTAQYSGDANYAQGAVSSPVTVTISGTANFTLSANPTSVVIAAAGQSQTSTITETGINGFADTVNFSCSVPAAMTETTCTLNPTSRSTSGNTTLTVTTTAPHTVVSPPNNTGWPVAGVGALLLCVFLLLIPGRRRRPTLAFGLLLFALLAAAFVGCGGGSSSGGGTTTDPGTPTGTYTVTVTGTSGSLVHTANVSVTVQ